MDLWVGKVNFTKKIEAIVGRKDVVRQLRKNGPFTKKGVVPGVTSEAGGSEDEGRDVYGQKCSRHRRQ